ncbi:MAG: interleukin-like EMT inducer domain-containing protein, partial [Caldilineaceae bacterium]
APDFKMEYFRRIPFFQALTEIEFGREVAPETLAAAKAQAEELMYLFNTGYLVLLPPISQRFPYAQHWEDAWQFVKETLPLEPEPFYAEDGIEAYRIVQPSGADQFMLDLGVPGTFPYRGEGWDETEVDSPYDTSAIWAVDDESRLFVPLRDVDPDRTYRVSVRLHPFTYPGSTTQSVTLDVNGTALHAQNLAEEWQSVSWMVPGSALLDGLNRFTLSWAYAIAPRTAVPGDRIIGETGVTLPVDADLKAFADGGYIALFDEAGEQIDASAGRRGINVTVLDTISGKVVESAGFDTAGSAYESEKLAAFMAGIEPGRPVLVASSGNAGEYLTQEGVDALRSIGAEVSQAELQENYFAIVGVAGAEPGTAAVAEDPAEAFLRISLNRDRRTLAAAVDWLETRPAP